MAWLQALVVAVWIMLLVPSVVMNRLRAWLQPAVAMDSDLEEDLHSLTTDAVVDPELARRVAELARKLRGVPTLYVSVTEDLMPCVGRQDQRTILWPLADGTWRGLVHGRWLAEPCTDAGALDILQS